MPTKRERQLYSEQFAILSKQDPLSITFGNGGEIFATIQAAGLHLLVELRVSIVSPPSRGKPGDLSSSGSKSGQSLSTVLHAAIPDSLTGSDKPTLRDALEDAVRKHRAYEAQVEHEKEDKPCS